jgi:hypothetical protein
MLVVLGATPGRAQEAQVCRFEGTAYREGARLCSNGLEVLCSNGTWQNLDGKRCDEAGAYLNPDQYFVVQDPLVVVPEPLSPPAWDRHAR